MDTGINGASLTKAAFSDLPVIGPIVLTVGLLTFVFQLFWAGRTMEKSGRVFVRN